MFSSPPPAGAGEGWGEGETCRSSHPIGGASSLFHSFFKSQSFHSLRERVTFFARAKEVTKESTLCRFEGVFAEATSLCLRRTAHFLCAVEVTRSRICQSESGLISMQPPS